MDDEPAVGRAIKMMLEHDGHKVQTADSGKEALALLGQNSFDLVTTDFSMPEMNGDELAVAIKQHLPKQPVLMISGNAMMSKSSGNPLTGVDLVISKPFLLDDLRKAIAKILTEIWKSLTVSNQTTTQIWMDAQQVTIGAQQIIIDGLQGQINDVRALANRAALMPDLMILDTEFHDPPTEADLEVVWNYINDMASQLQGGW